MNTTILTKEHILSLGYTNVEEVAPRIFLIEGFLLDSELELLLKTATEATDEEWTYHYMEGVRELARLKFGEDADLDTLVEEGKYEITQNWQDKNLKIIHLPIIKTLDDRGQEIFNFRDDLRFNGCGTIQRQYSGVPLLAHVDNHTDPSLEYAAVIYLNDDYVDGEVFFTHQGIQLRPKPGSILLFPTGDEFLHGVHAPGDGPIRYIIPSFISRKEFYNKLRENNYEIDKTISEVKKP